MNTLKPLVIFAVLVGICYGVYSKINHKPVETDPEWQPSVQLGDTVPQFSAADAGPRAATLSIPGAGHAHPEGTAAGDAHQYYPPAGAAAPGAWNDAGPNGNYGPPAGNTDFAPPGQEVGYGKPANPSAAEYGAPHADGYSAGDPMTSAGAAGRATTAFGIAFEQAKRDLESHRLAEAHYQLSRWYDDPSLSPAESQQLVELLDQLAGTVIYSTQHLIEPAYDVQMGETLDRIAQQHNVPTGLLAKINGLEDPNALRPGERLKVLRGPFSAIVSLDKRQLTLMLNGAYAGRFPIGIGRDHPPELGEFHVTNKTIDPIYYGAGRTIERGSPENPLGHRWIGIGDKFGLHGTNDPRNLGRADLAGSISLSDRDIADVFDILSEGSKVVVRH